MNQKTNGHLCWCPCHGTIKIHETNICECGKPITPPPRECYPAPKHHSIPCPPPGPKCQPGVIDLPQPPPFKVPTSPTPPDKDKPKAGDPAELPWFRGKIDQIVRKGPVFGPRKDEFLPYLLVRAASGDRGARPFNEVFWESPDIFVRSNQEASTAPLIPPTSAPVAQANVPNTLYAHVWNLGNASAYRVRVEFYWFNPSLGISRSDANLIGSAWIDLADRFTLHPQWIEAEGLSGKYMTRGCHAIVRCPSSWVPRYENQGHECLVVRAFEPIFDSLDPDQFSSSADRHVAQRNIAVIQAASPAAIDLTMRLGYAEAPADAEVEVETDNPASMEWLKIFTGKSDPGFQPATSKIISGFIPPGAAGSRTLQVNKTPKDFREQILTPRERFHRGCCPLQIAFHASIDDIGARQAKVLRIRQRVNGSVIGGYTVVLMGKQ